MEVILRQEEIPEAAAYEVMFKNRIDSGIQSGVLSGRFGTDIKGILEIYGTTNRLTNIYFIIGGMFLILGVFLYCLKKQSELCREVEA